MILSKWTVWIALNDLLWTKQFYNHVLNTEFLIHYIHYFTCLASMLKQNWIQIELQTKFSKQYYNGERRNNNNDNF